jgi:hypothetical protein
MSAKIQDSSYLKVAFKFSKSTPRGHRLISTVAHQVGGGSATQPLSTQNGGNDEFDEAVEKVVATHRRGLWVRCTAPDRVFAIAKRATPKWRRVALAKRGIYRLSKP